MLAIDSLHKDTYFLSVKNDKYLPLNKMIKSVK